MLRAVGIAIEETGSAPYVIIGDPVTALIAQLNRFAGKTVKTGEQAGSVEALKQGTTRIGCYDRVFLTSPLPLIPSLDPRGATAAVLIVWARYACSPLAATSAAKERWAFSGFDSPWTFVMNNLNEITVTVAQYGDSQGLPAAKVGITERDPRLVPPWKFPTTPVLMGLGVGILASFATSRIRRVR